jgi:WD40 repeat protein
MESIDPDYYHDPHVTQCMFSPDEMRLITIADNGSIRMWDTQTGFPVSQLRPGNEHVTSHHVVRSSDDTRHVLCDSDGTTYMWDWKTGLRMDANQQPGVARGGSSEPTNVTLPQVPHALWRAISREGETVIEDTVTGQVVARFPIALQHITTQPSSCQWAGSAGNHLCLIALEGDAPRTS